MDVLEDIEHLKTDQELCVRCDVISRVEKGERNIESNLVEQSRKEI